jgi:peptide/nickel transport system ATP-binding protein
MTVSSLLKVRGLSVGLKGNGRPLVKRVDLDVNAGETVCIVGESGSGKSITAFSIMGLLPRDSVVATGGTIDLAGEDLLAASDARLRALRATEIAMIFQEPMTALNPVYRVGDLVDEVLRTHTTLDRASRRRRILEMMGEVGLPDVERIYASYPHQLSGGQRQRIVIAMALILRPRLLIADEPTTALDVTTQKQILSLIRDLQQSRGMGVLFITHDMGVVAEIADRVVVLRNGEIVEQGTVREVLANPREDYTRQLLLSVPSLVPRAAKVPGKATALLDVAALAKVYRSRSFFGAAREVVAASDVSLTVRHGRTLGIVGESGSGKTTVARCVMRLVEASGGAIVMSDQDIAKLRGRQLKPYRRKIQIIFQDPYRSLNPRVSVGESIIEGPTNFGTPRAVALAEAGRLLELVGMSSDALSRYPHQFSGGQRQRIALARALAMKPEVLVADEAVSALDVSVQAQVLELLKDLQTRLGLGILFVTHDLRVAAQICDEVIVMQKGRIVEHGPTAQVLVEPKSTYARTLIDAAPGRHWNFSEFGPIGSKRETSMPSA